MNSKEQAIDLREMTRELVKNLSLLDRDRASCCGVTLAQCHAIVEIGSMGKTSPSVLAVLLRLDRSTVTRVVD
ncbi:MAG: helix-turn-helix domain-containing protein, partial [Thermovirgaceae bacterium]|nr:helix-turn-helix domain-containing protein [Thermovirgaceae bacterium]